MFYCLLHEYRIYTYFSLLTIQRSLRSTLFPYTTLFRSVGAQEVDRLLPDPAAVVRRGRDGIKAAPTAPKGLLVQLWVSRTEPAVVRVLGGSRIRIVCPPEYP